MARIDFTVTTAADSGAGSLRQALADAQARFDYGAGGEEDYAAIRFDQGLYGQTIRLASRLEITQGDIRIYGDVNGNGDSDITISGDSDASGDFTPNDSQILMVGAAGAVRLDQLTLDRGSSVTAEGAEPVHAISNAGRLTISNSTISNSYVRANTVTFGGLTYSVSSAAPVLNTGALFLADTLFTDGFIFGGRGRDESEFGGPGRGTDAAGGVINSGTLFLARTGFDGTVGAGQGGDSLGFSPTTSGAGGDAARGVINTGTVSRFEGSTVIGSGDGFLVAGGAGRAGTGSYGAQGAADPDILNRSGGTSDGFTLATGDGFGTAGDDEITITGGAARAVLGFAGNDTILGGAGNDSLYGGAGSDEIIVGSGAAVRADGGAGTDLIALTSLTGNHDLRGGANRNALDFSRLAVTEGQTGVTVDLSIGGAQTARAGLTLTLSDFAQAVGTRGADRLTGTDQGDLLVGFLDLANGESLDFSAPPPPSGSDSLYGGGGSDYLIAGGAANLRLSGGEGRDFIITSGEAMNVTGDGGDDTILITGGSGEAAGGGGEGGLDDGTDTIGFRTDFGVFASLASGVATDLPNFGGLNLIISQFESLSGSDLDDQLTGDDDANRLVGRGGADGLFGLGGNDTLLGFEGNDTLTGGEGADSLAGGTEADLLFGEGGDDTLEGEGGDDTLEGGTGLNVLNGGAGNDLAVFRSALSDYTLTRSGATVTIANATETATVTGVERFFFTDVGEVAFATLFPGAPPPDTPEPPPVTPPVSPPSTPPAGPTTGDDVLTGTGGPDRIAALAGDDTVRGRGGDDTLLGQRGEDVLRGGGGDDSLKGGGQADRMFGQGANDTLKGGGGADFMKGGGGADRIIGGGGADTIEGNKGADTLKGGGGADLFRFKPGDGDDVIQRFQQGADQVEFKRGVSGFDDLRVEQQGDDVLVTYTRGSILFENQNAGAFGEDDFIF